MRHRLLRLVGLILAGLLFVHGAWAQVSPGHDLSWHVAAGGGNDMASGSRIVRSTLGQFAIGPTWGSGHTLGAGYWYGMQRGAPPPSLYKTYLPLVIRDW